MNALCETIEWMKCFLAFYGLNSKFCFLFVIFFFLHCDCKFNLLDPKIILLCHLFFFCVFCFVHSKQQKKKKLSRRFESMKSILCNFYWFLRLNIYTQMEQWCWIFNRTIANAFVTHKNFFSFEFSVWIGVHVHVHVFMWNK